MNSPNVCEKKKKTSQYKGVYWHRKNRKWTVRICPKGQKQKYGGMFEDELDAAKKVNQLCEEFGIPAQNSETSAMPNQQYQVTIIENLFCLNYEIFSFFNFFPNIFS